MEALVLDLLAAYGPATLFVLAVLETSFVTGLVVPSGTIAALAAALAVQAGEPVGWILWSTGLGGWVGDVLGYGIGWRGGEALAGRDDWVGRAIRKHDEAAGRFLGRHPLFSVTLARLVSFVRTLMPLSAGMARVHPGTFLLYELPGVVGWVVIYVGIGVLAGESWRRVTSLVGAGWLVLFGVVGLALWLRTRGRTAPSVVSPGAEGVPGPGSDPGSGG